MADDIVTRLRAWARDGVRPYGKATLREAADEIERLRAVVDALAEQDDALEELTYPNNDWLTAYSAAVAIGKEARRG